MNKITIEKRETRKAKERFEMNKYSVNVEREFADWEKADAIIKELEFIARESIKRQKEDDRETP